VQVRNANGLSHRTDDTIAPHGRSPSTSIVPRLHEQVANFSLDFFNSVPWI
jgi:hypothetical protein